MTTPDLVDLARQNAPVYCGVDYDDLPPAAQALQVEIAREWTADPALAKVWPTRAAARAATNSKLQRRQIRQEPRGWVRRDGTGLYRR
jgi:hypothetical protein